MYFDSKPLWSVIIYLEDKKCVHKIRNATWYKCNAVIFFLFLLNPKIYIWEINLETHMVCIHKQQFIHCLLLMLCCCIFLSSLSISDCHTKNKIQRTVAHSLLKKKRKKRKSKGGQEESSKIEQSVYICHTILRGSDFCDAKIPLKPDKSSVKSEIILFEGFALPLKTQ